MISRGAIISAPRAISIRSPVTMPATHGHNKACCNIPPVVASGYAPKGAYEQLGGMKTCETLTPRL